MSAFVKYWDTVIGPSRSEESTCVEFGLVHGPVAGFSEWLGTAEEAALSQMNLSAAERADLLTEWAPHHRKAARNLQEAALKLRASEART